MSYRRAEQRPPEMFRPASAQAGHRLDDHLFEVDPSLMTDHVPQQDMPVWDTIRIAHARVEHLEWMHRHWAALTISGAELLAELDGDASSATQSSTGPNDGNAASEARS
jgi:hypothetical protein